MSQMKDAARWAAVVACGGLTLLSAGAALSEEREADLSGTYALLQESVSVTKLPVVSDVTATTRTVSLHRLTHTTGRLRGTGTICELSVSSTSSMVNTELPAAFRRAIPKVELDAKLTERAGVLFFDQDATTLVLGAKLKSSREALPTSPSDGRVWDQDRDGHPGVTVRVSGIVSGDIYLASRSTSSLHGQLSGREFRGSLRFKSEESILDATSSFLRSGPKAEPDLSRSRFRLVRLGDAATCSDASRTFSDRQ